MAERKELPPEVIQDFEAFNAEHMQTLKFQRTEFDYIKNKVGDSRVVTDFAPHRMGTRRTLDDPDAVAAYHKFAQEYYSGDPERRKPYVEAMFDIIETLHPGDIYTDREKVIALGAENGRRGHWATYADNVISDNPEYFMQRYDTPLKRAKILSDIGLAQAYNSYSKQVIVQYGYDTANGTKIPVGTPGMTVDEEKVAYYMLENAHNERVRRMAAVEGKPMSTHVLTDMEIKGASCCLLADHFSKGNIKEEKDIAIVATRCRDLLVGALSRGNPYYSTLATAGGYAITDYVFIDGKNANELYGQKYAHLDERQQRESIQAEVLAALGTGKHRVELAQVMEDNEGKPKVTMQQVKLDVSKTQPSIEQEYGPVRRLFNWGPFKCKTRQERMDALEAKDPKREERHKAILAQMEPKIVGDLENIRIEAERKSAEAAAAIQRAKELERVKEVQPKVAALIAEREKQTINLDDKFFAHVVTDQGKKPETDKEMSGLMASRYLSIFKLDRAATRGSLCKFMMLADGCKLSDLDIDSPEMDARRAEAGKATTDLLDEGVKAFKNRAAEPEKYQQYLSKTADIFCKAGMALAAQPFPDIDYSNLKDLAENYVEVRARASLCIDFSQLMKGPLRGEVDKRLDPEQKNAFALTESLGGHVGDSIDAYFKGLQMGEDKINVNFISPAYAGKKVLEEISSDIRGKSVSQIAGKMNATEAVQRIYDIKMAAIETAIGNEPLLESMKENVFGKKLLPVSLDETGRYRFGDVAAKASNLAPARTKTSLKELEPEKKQPVTQATRTADKTLEKKAEGPGRK